MKLNIAREKMAQHYAAVGSYYKELLASLPPLPSLDWVSDERLSRRFVQEIMVYSVKEKLRNTCSFNYLKSKNESLYPNYRFILLCTLKFLFRALRLYCKILTTRNKIKPGPYTLVYGLPPSVFLNEESKNACISFLKNRLGTSLPVIQQAGSSPLEDCLGAPGIKLLGRLQLLFQALAFHANFIILVIRDSRVAVLHRDFLLAPIAVFLNYKSLIANVCYTNSLYDRQELFWFISGKKFELHMFWYSANNFGPCYFIDSSGEAVHPGYPTFMLMSYDVGWYWDKSQHEFFTRMMGPHRHGYFAPVMFKEIPRIKASPGKNPVAVLFDILPFTKAWAQEHGLEYNYYEVETLQLFIKDCVESLTGRGFRVMLKTKRQPVSVHNGQYDKFIRDLEKKNSTFVILDPSTDVVDLVATADCIVSIPFTSPTVIGAYLDRACAYYDPTQELVPIHHPHEGITFLSGREELEAWVSGLTSYKQR